MSLDQRKIWPFSYNFLFEVHHVVLQTHHKIVGGTYAVISSYKIFNYRWSPETQYMHLVQVLRILI